MAFWCSLKLGTRGADSGEAIWSGRRGYPLARKNDKIMQSFCSGIMYGVSSTQMIEWGACNILSQEEYAPLSKHAWVMQVLLRR